MVLHINVEKNIFCISLNLLQICSMWLIFLNINYVAPKVIPAIMCGYLLVRWSECESE